MGQEQNLREQRVRKLTELRSAGYEPYANDFRPEMTSREVQVRHERDDTEQLKAMDRFYTLAGRVVALRKHGKSTFFNIQDRTGTLQIYVQSDKVGETVYAHLKTVDLGDIVGIAGSPMRTRTGELTLAASGFRILTKSLIPPPEKWHGLTDVEARYRRRYVDLIHNPDARAIFRKRAAIVAQIRRFLDMRDYLEVETPILLEVAGGAAAAPFLTHYNALDSDFALRIATELHLKRLVVGGFERVYEIGKCFRNEGLSRKHNPEFTSLELYQAYATAADLIELTEELLTGIASKVAEGDSITYQGQQIALTRPFARISVADAVSKHLGVESLADIKSVQRAAEVVFGHTNDSDPINAILDDLEDDEVGRLLPDAGSGTVQQQCDAARAAYLKATDRRAALMAMAQGLDGALDETRRRAIALHLLYTCFEHEVESTLIQPTFVTHYPQPASPLARRFDQDPAVVDRFELFIAGMEVANAFSELSDPIDQRQRFERQVRLKSRGDAEAPGMDEDFIHALEVGLPPTAGEGIGIDRLTMLFCDAATIREVILFPQLRPDEGWGGEPAVSEPESKE